MVTAPTCDSEGYTTYTCGSCGDSYVADYSAKLEHSYVDGTCEPCGAEEPPKHIITIVGANMTLGNDLAMNFMLSKSDVNKLDAASLYIRVTKYYADGTSVSMSTDLNKMNSYNSSYWAVTFANIAAKEMADDIVAQVFYHDNDEDDSNDAAASEPYATSIRAYLVKGLGSSTFKTNMRRLAVDMLNYGTAAQIAFNYNVNDLANNAVTEEQQNLYATKEKPTCVNQNVKGTNCLGGNMSLESSLVLNMFFSGLTESNYRDTYAIIAFTDFRGDYQEVRIEGEDFAAYTANAKKICITAAKAADGRCLITCTVYNADGSVLGTGVDSVESYVARGRESSSLTDAQKDLNEATMKFADSAANYLIHGNK